MGLSPGALTFLLLAVVLVFTWQSIFTANKDLARAKAWGDLLRRALPFFVLIVMALSLPAVQTFEGNGTVVWIAVFAVLIVGASLLAAPMLERKANRAFKKGDYDEAARMFRELAESRPLPRNYAFLGAALGASERYEESVKSSTQAIEKDPEYGLAYYNRALILLKMKRKEKARQDFQRALEADTPRRFRQAARSQLTDLKKV
ncbi:MAG: tetratricopeptide repeat protein [Rubrobacter sp.]